MITLEQIDRILGRGLQYALRKGSDVNQAHTAVVTVV